MQVVLSANLSQETATAHAPSSISTTSGAPAWLFDAQQIAFSQFIIWHLRPSPAASPPRLRASMASQRRADFDLGQFFSYLAPALAPSSTSTISARARTRNESVQVVLSANLRVRLRPAASPPRLRGHMPN